jgi:TolA-binding protein
MRSALFTALTIVVLAALVAPAPALAASSKDTLELQRELSQMEQEAKDLVAALDAKIASVQTLDRQTLDQTNKNGASLSVINTGMSQSSQSETTRWNDLSEKLTGLTVKLDSLTTGLSDLRSSFESLLVVVNKQQQTLSDLMNLTRLNQTPVAAPPEPDSATARPTSRPPTGEELFGNGTLDVNGGKPELALSEFGEFLRLYPDDPLSGKAHFQIAEIYYGQQSLDHAIEEYDAAIRLAPRDTTVAPDAYLRKGMALQKAKKRQEAIASFQAVIEKFPRSPQAERAAAELKSIRTAASSAK